MISPKDKRTSKVLKGLQIQIIYLANNYTAVRKKKYINVSNISINQISFENIKVFLNLI